MSTTVKKISELELVYEDGRPNEQAIIVIPSTQVEGLEEKLTYWIVYDIE